MVYGGEGNGNPLQYSFLENPMDTGAWRATVRGVTESQTRLSDLAQDMVNTKSAPAVTQGTRTATWFILPKYTITEH